MRPKFPASELVGGFPAPEQEGEHKHIFLYFSILAAFMFFEVFLFIYYFIYFLFPNNFSILSEYLIHFFLLFLT